MEAQADDRRTRRAVLLGAFGAVAALAGHAIARPETVLAVTDGQAVHKGVNNSASATTSITNTSGTAIKGVANTSTQGTHGVLGSSSSPHGGGVKGFGVFGVLGFATGSQGAAGVYGQTSAANSFGMQGQNLATSGDAVGVQGVTKSPTGIGVVGIANAASGTNRRGVVGRGDESGVVGFGVDHGVLGLGAAVGVEGSVTNADGIAIRADVSDLGAQAVAAFFTGGGTNDALALKTDGPVRFIGSSGTATVPNGTNQVTVNTGVKLTSSSKILCTLLALPGGTTTIQAAEPSVGGTSFVLRLTDNTTQAVKLAWFVIS